MLKKIVLNPLGEGRLNSLAMSKKKRLFLLNYFPSFLLPLLVLFSFYCSPFKEHWEDKMKKPGLMKRALCEQDACSSWLRTVDSGFCPAIALSFNLVLVPLSLPLSMFLILIKLDHTKAALVSLSIGQDSLQDVLGLVHQFFRLPKAVTDHNGTAISLAHSFPFSEYMF